MATTHALHLLSILQLIATAARRVGSCLSETCHPAALLAALEAALHQVEGLNMAILEEAVPGAVLFQRRIDALREMTGWIRGRIGLSMTSVDVLKTILGGVHLDLLSCADDAAQIEADIQDARITNVGASVI